MSVDFVSLLHALDWYLNTSEKILKQAEKKAGQFLLEFPTPRHSELWAKNVWFIERLRTPKCRVLMENFRLQHLSHATSQLITLKAEFVVFQANAIGKNRPSSENPPDDFFHQLTQIKMINRRRIVLIKTNVLSSRRDVIVTFANRARGQRIRRRS